MTDEVVDDRLLWSAAERARERDFFLAGPVFRYMEMRGLTHDQLAAELECKSSSIWRLALCRRPEAASDDFRIVVESIADLLKIQPPKLANLLRSGLALEAIATPGRHLSRGGLLAAARDDLQPQPPAELDEDHDGS